MVSIGNVSFRFVARTGNNQLVRGIVRLMASVMIGGSGIVESVISVPMVFLFLVRAVEAFRNFGMTK